MLGMMEDEGVKIYEGRYNFYTRCEVRKDRVKNPKGQVHPTDRPLALSPARQVQQASTLLPPHTDPHVLATPPRLLGNPSPPPYPFPAEPGLSHETVAGVHLGLAAELPALLPAPPFPPGAGTGRPPIFDWIDPGAKLLPGERGSDPPK